MGIPFFLAATMGLDPLIIVPLILLCVSPPADIIFGRLASKLGCCCFDKVRVLS